METKTCKDRVKENLKGRITDLTKLWKLYLENPEKSDEDLGNMYEYGLSFDYVAPNTFKGQRKGYFRYQLSWGGPSDEFRIYVDLGYNPYRIEYWFLDWFDGAYKILYGENFKLLVEIFQMFFVDSGTAQAKYEETTNASRHQRHALGSGVAALVRELPSSSAPPQ